jgi:predicted negative regulator of RcsB-dependent stress response
MIWSREVLLGILIAFLISGLVGGYTYYRSYQEKRLDELAGLVYLHQKGELGEEEVLEKVKGTPIEAYLILSKGKFDPRVIDLVEDEDFKKLLIERHAYELYKEGKKELALKELEKINEDDFNYPSALLLKGLIYKSMGQKEKAMSLFGELASKFEGTYFGSVAQAMIYQLKE